MEIRWSDNPTNYTTVGKNRICEGIYIRGGINKRSQAAVHISVINNNSEISNTASIEIPVENIEVVIEGLRSAKLYATEARDANKKDKLGYTTFYNPVSKTYRVVDECMPGITIGECVDENTANLLINALINNQHNQE